MLQCKSPNVRLIRTAREVNNAKPELIVAKARAKAARIQNPTLACLGLAYKADIDDLRESPAVEIALHLALGGIIGRVLAVEPHIETLQQRLSEAGVQLCGPDEALGQADILLGLVAHRRFQRLSRQALQEKILIDACGLWR